MPARLIRRMMTAIARTLLPIRRTVLEVIESFG
jgi:hypothetical protein